LRKSHSATQLVATSEQESGKFALRRLWYAAVLMLMVQAASKAGFLV
jgi:hypothetical protein